MRLGVPEDILDGEFQAPRLLRHAVARGHIALRVKTVGVRFLGEFVSLHGGKNG